MAKQTFTTGQVLTAAQMTSLQQTAMGGGAATAKTASYVLVAADAGTTVAMNAAGSTTITVNTSLFAAGDTVYIQNLGAGACTITAGTATVNTSASLTLAQYEGGLLYFVSASASVFLKGAGAGGSVTTYAVFNDTKGSGVNGGTFTTGAWRTRDLQTSQFNNITSCSLASNQITLPAGTYKIEGNAEAYVVGRHQTRIYNITDSATLFLGRTEYADSANDVATASSFIGIVVLTGTKVIELQHQGGVTRATDGFGVQTTFGDNVYSVISITKVA